jgi:hypothetical protein
MDNEQRDDPSSHGPNGKKHLLPRVVTRARRADASLVSLVRQRPLPVLAAAVLAGYFIGRIFSRAR